MFGESDGEDVMVRFALIGTAVCTAFLTATPSDAQTPQVTGPAARAVTQPRVVLMTPATRAQMASSLLGEPIAAAEITNTVSVSTISPLVGDPAAPTLALSAREPVEWSTFGDPRVSFRSGVVRFARLSMQLAAGYRHLMVCEMSTRGFDTRNPDLPITWEGSNRGAILIPPRTSGGRENINLYATGPGWLRSCEVSRIG